MSFEAVDLVLRSEIRDRTLFNVLLALAFFLNPENGDCFPSTEAISQMSRVNDRLVRTSLKRLKELGLISFEQKAGLRRYFSLHLDKLLVCEPLNKDAPLHENAVHETTGEGCTKIQGTPVEKYSDPLYETTAEQVIEQVIEQDSIGSTCSKSKFDLLVPMEAVDEEIHGENVPPSRGKSSPCHGEEVHPKQVIEQGIEQVSTGSTDPKSKFDNTKAKRDPPVKCPNPIPKEWIEEAKALRRDIDVAALANKFVCYYAPTTTRKALKNWKRTWTGWVGREKPKRVDLTKPQDWVFKHYSAEDYNTDFD